MGLNPTDLGQDFVNQGMRLITQTSSDALLEKASKSKATDLSKEEICNTELWDPTTGPIEPDPICDI